MKKNNFLFQTGLTILFSIICFLTIFPFLLLLSTAFTSEHDLMEYGFRIIPKNISLDAFKFVFKDPMVVFRAYGVTGLFSTVVMVLGTFLMALIAFPLSRKEFMYRKSIGFYIYFTMLFGGGLVPTFILITQYLKLSDNLLVYILPYLISPWYVFLLRSFFQELPDSIFESVRIDGGGEWRVFLQFVLPLSKPAIASVMLFTFLISWNDWQTSLLYINNDNLISLQYLLQKIMTEAESILNMSDMGMGSMVDVSKLPAETGKMAMAVVVAGPALVIFPFFQKYFVTGLTVGGVKG